MAADGEGERPDGVRLERLKCVQSIAALTQPAYRTLEHEIPRLESWKATSRTECWATLTPCTTSGDSGGSDRLCCHSGLSLVLTEVCALPRGPDALKHIVGLSVRKCKACEGKDVKPLSPDEANKLRNQVPGRQIVEGSDGIPTLRQDWKASMRHLAALAAASSSHRLWT